MRAGTKNKGQRQARGRGEEGDVEARTRVTEMYIGREKHDESMYRCRDTDRGTSATVSLSMSENCVRRTRKVPDGGSGRAEY